MATSDCCGTPSSTGKRSSRYDPAMSERKPRRGQWISGLLFVILAVIAIGAIVLQLSVAGR